MKSVGLLIALLIVTRGYTQAPDTLWTRTYGQLGHDVGNSIKQTSDGGYIIAGSTQPLPILTWDVWLLKIDGNGEIEWTTTWGDAEDEWAGDVHQTTDGGYIVLAIDYGPPPPSPTCFCLIKTSNMGDITWVKSYTCYDFGAWGFDIQPTSDSGYVITGANYSGTQPSLVLYKTDANGDTVWHRGYESGSGAMGLSVCENFDGGYIIGGIYTPQSQRAWGGILLKTDIDGNEVWRVTYEGQEISSVRQTDDSGYVACAAGDAFNSNLWIIKTDCFGATSWTQTYGISSMRGNSLDLTDDNAYIFTGSCDDSTGDYDVLLFKTDENGDSLWCVVYGGAGSEAGSEVLQTNDGGYIVVGYTSSYDAGGRDVYVIRTAPDVSIEESGPAVATYKGIITTILRGPLQLPEGKMCRVLDIIGRVVEPDKVQPGIYFLEIDGVVTQKVVKVR